MAGRVRVRPAHFSAAPKRRLGCGEGSFSSLTPVNELTFGSVSSLRTNRFGLFGGHWQNLLQRFRDRGERRSEVSCAAASRVVRNSDSHDVKEPCRCEHSHLTLPQLGANPCLLQGLDTSPIPPPIPQTLSQPTPIEIRDTEDDGSLIISTVSSRYSTFAPVLLRSLAWPGAFTVARGALFTNIYIGSSHPRFAICVVYWLGVLCLAWLRVLLVHSTTIRRRLNAFVLPPPPTICGDAPELAEMIDLK